MKDILERILAAGHETQPSLQSIVPALGAGSVHRRPSASGPLAGGTRIARPRSFPTALHASRNWVAASRFSSDGVVSKYTQLYRETALRFFTPQNTIDRLVDYCCT